MSVKPNHLREDIEDQFELPDLPPRMTANRAKDFRKPCANCKVEECPCLQWQAFETVH
ncbi:hypothetical protein GGE56_006588 [Rhizobium leguminosarum]|nr:hypothetical protein [Rhizobium leguminosarum]MBB6298247.1 hypothetical protein [Rhizobium leguminosarum]